MLFEQSKNLIQKLDMTEWFSYVGEPIQANVDQVFSWQNAVSACEDLNWEGTHWRVRSYMFDVIDVAAKASKGDSPRMWNKVMSQIESEVLPIIQKKTLVVVEKHNLPKRFIDQVEWDMCHIIAASEYSDVYQTPFYDELVSWYLKGHFPCGWNGHYPEGKLIVF